MSSESNIFLISDDDKIVNGLKTKLILLREIDDILITTYSEAMKNIEEIVPKTVLIYCSTEKKECLNLIKAIKTNERTEKTSILLIVEKYEQDFILSAYDENITDYLILNAYDTEILMRTIWCLKKNTDMLTIDKQYNLLEELGVIDKSSGFYTDKYCERIFEIELNRLRELGTKAILMLISAGEESKIKLNTSKLAQAIKNSIRNSDMVAQDTANRFYVLLENTKLNGAFCVWEKIKRAIGEQYKINAGISVIDNKNFEELKNELLSALLEALSANQDLIIVNKEKESTSDDWLEKINSAQKNFKLFKQAFNKKLEKVITPVFFQIQKLYEEKLFKTQIEQYSNSDLSSFILKKENQISELKITYPGFSKINIDIIHQGLDSPENKRINLDLTELDESRLTEILEEFIKEFKAGKV